MTTVIHKERAFEDIIDAHLVEHGGWLRGDPADFDRTLAIHPNQLFPFIQANQPKLWAELQGQHKAGLEQGVLDALGKALEADGALDVARHGFKFYGKRILVASFKPAHGLNPEVMAAYERNRLVVTRQVKFIPDKEDSIDMVLLLNGLPIATVELKSHLTGQNVEHAKSQYKGRDPKHAIFRFKRGALVHFAVDPDLVFMTTRLQGGGTNFLPFNLGDKGGKGNPPNPSGYKTAYLWEQVWQRDSFLDIVGRFLAFVTEEVKRPDGKTIKKEKLVFPRYHQLDAVRKLEAAAKQDGPGKSYLIQHSAGSGKSNSIAWLAHRLQSLHGSEDQKLFDLVVVVTDRRLLDRQLQDVIYQFEHKQGVVLWVEKHSDQLADALKGGTPIIITTLQKFPFVVEKIGELPDRSYAVIVDEAHSSQSGEAAQKMKQVLAATSLEEAAKEDAEGPTDYEDEIVKVMKSRGRQKNLSFFAFTATPKAKTLEFFGTAGPDGKPVAFHLYSMRQAIEEGFILDVLLHYTTYKTYYRLVKAIADDPKVLKKQAAKALARFMSFHPHNVTQKTEVMVEHFRQRVRHRIGGRAKAMVVTSSRLHAVRYRQAFEKYIKDHGYDDIHVLVAFSGTVKDPETGAEYTEPGMNVHTDGTHIPEKALRDYFHRDDYQLLLAANKYQTGFDEPLLQAMYVDKRLSGVQAVQTLSRLNRPEQAKGDPFVLDFVNEPEEIQRSFQPYYEQTTVAEQADPQQLYELQHRLDATQVYFQSEVEAFAKVFYSPKETPTDQAQMVKHLDPAVDRFKALDDEKKTEFRDALSAYVKLYAFLAQIMPFSDSDLEKLYSFGRFLLRKLPPDDGARGIRLDDDVALRYYRLQRISEGSIPLEVRDSVGLKGPTDVGTRQAKEDEVRLSEIIDILNERFGTDFTKADRLVLDQIVEDGKADADVVERANANALDNFELAMKPKLEGMMIDRMERNQEIVTRYLNDPAFREVLDRFLAKQMYDEIRGPKEL